MNLDSEEDALLLPSIVPVDYAPPQHLAVLDAPPPPPTTTAAATVAAATTTTMAQPDHNPLNALPY